MNKIKNRILVAVMVLGSASGQLSQDKEPNSTKNSSYSKTLKESA